MSPEAEPADLERLITSAAQGVAEAIWATLPERDQAIADGTVKAMLEAGWLRETPARLVSVRRIQRNAQGQIVALIETVEQNP